MVTIWNLLRDFFVEYIFGGTNSNGYIRKCRIGSLNIFDGSTVTNVNPGSNTDVYFEVGSFGGNTYGLNMGDWLSTTATIITLIVFVAILFLFLKWLFKVISGFILLK